MCNHGIDISALYYSSYTTRTTKGDKYCGDKKTLGFIDLGFSENKPCIDLMTKRLPNQHGTVVEPPPMNQKVDSQSGHMLGLGAQSPV
ncbi:1-aminocyclopropane-1-carboxylate synthase-like protein 2 [Myotis brandtii]|uniref:1-aminocyclopropane-1-carboxylate synthase-like protein 2 n=1 Tax=Myotis brandtii TaxID=109478 RepID=S7PPT5_MYOBR|nr:1-aminocyclopropane-1-carboxylate synthase-like protein 2 [Myotis brandtii]